MSRVEKNKKMVDWLLRFKTDTGGFKTEDAITVLIDISQNLAIIADKLTEGEAEEG